MEMEIVVVSLAAGVVVGVLLHKYLVKWTGRSI